MPQPDEESGRIFATLLQRNAINFHSPAFGAGIVSADMGPEEIRAEIRASLARVGMGG